MAEGQVARHVLDQDPPAEPVLNPTDALRDVGQRLVRVRQRQQVMGVVTSEGAPAQVLRDPGRLEAVGQLRELVQVAVVQRVGTAEVHRNAVQHDRCQRARLLEHVERAPAADDVLQQLSQQAGLAIPLHQRQRFAVRGLGLRGHRRPPATQPGDELDLGASRPIGRFTDGDLVGGHFRQQLQAPIGHADRHRRQRPVVARDHRVAGRDGEPDLGHGLAALGGPETLTQHQRGPRRAHRVVLQRPLGAEEHLHGRAHHAGHHAAEARRHVPHHFQHFGEPLVGAPERADVEQHGAHPAAFPRAGRLAFGRTCRGEARRTGHGQCRILREHGLFQLPQSRTGLDAELGDEHRASAAVHRERLGLPSRAVERQHQLAAQPFPQGLGLDQRRQLADHLAVPAARELGLEAVLPGGEPGFLQRAEDRPGDARVGQVGQRLAAPQRERAAEDLGRGTRVTGRGRRPALGHEGLELVQVDAFLGHAQQVARFLAQHRDDFAARIELLQCLAHSPHRVVQHVLRRRGWRVTPKRVHGLGDRHRAVDVQQKKGQERALRHAAERDLAAVVDDLEGAEHRKPHQTEDRVLPRRTGAPDAQPALPTQRNKQTGRSRHDHERAKLSVSCDRRTSAGSGTHAWKAISAPGPNRVNRLATWRYGLIVRRTL